VSHYSDHEKVMHKLLGAAFFMTYTGHHRMAAEIAATADAYWKDVEKNGSDGR